MDKSTQNLLLILGAAALVGGGYYFYVKQKKAADEKNKALPQGGGSTALPQGGGSSPQPLTLGVSTIGRTARLTAPLRGTEIATSAPVTLAAGMQIVLGTSIGGTTGFTFIDPVTLLPRVCATNDDVYAVLG